MKILIAEDDEALAREIQMACTRWGLYRGYRAGFPANRRNASTAEAGPSVAGYQSPIL